MNTNNFNLLNLPKVELHCHLEGALRFSTLIELAKSFGHKVPTTQKEQREYFLVETPMTDLISVLRKFDTTQRVLQSEEILSRITYEAIEDNFNQGVKILELRYSPTFILNNHEHLNFEKIHRGILKGIALAKKLPIAVGLICIFQRTQRSDILNQVFDFMKETQETWIGADLADDELNFPAKNFNDLFDRIAALDMPITIHAGEIHHPSSPKNVIDAIKHLHAKRIGHGLQIIKDPSALKTVIENKIPLELCPTSNWLTNAISNLNTHPIKLLIEKGVLCTINSDDPGIFGINLMHEYELLHKHYGFSFSDFENCNDIAARASFIAKNEKQKYWNKKIS